MRDVGCGFFAATTAAYGSFLGKSARICLTLRRNAAHTVHNRRKMVNATVTSWLAQSAKPPVGQAFRSPRMFSVFVPAEASLKKAVITDLAALPEHAVWIDLVNPTAPEDKAVERLAGIAVPTRED